MFKIQKSVNGKLVVFTLSGRIKAASLAELQKLLEAEAGDHNVIFWGSDQAKKTIDQTEGRQWFVAGIIQDI